MAGPVARDHGSFGRLEAPGPRSAFVERMTRETQIRCEVDLDGVGRSAVSTPIGFLTHMLEAFARHAHVDLAIAVQGDLEVDQHHTVEDTGLVLGEALRRALGDRRGIWRTASLEFPMDETRAACAIDLSGRPFLIFDAHFTRDHIGTLASDLLVEFFAALTNSLAANLHLRLCCGENDHHKAEALFKAFARAFELAAAIHPRAAAEIPSTKGALDQVGVGTAVATAVREATAARLVATTSGGFSLDDLEDVR
ncbi:MAG: imidazoleglycerol-phosphate dehydratase HisB [Deltaproteobacteria bacterium]|nr:imidazoleglycerol-phosphate dehydratase HisB [Deltaproteobacteria bacterium]